VWEFKGRGKKTLGDVEYAEDWRAVLLLRGHGADVREVAWSADGTLLASGSVDNKVLIWNIGGKQTTPVRVLEGHTGQVSGLAFDPVSKFLVSLGEDCALIVWSTQDWRVLHRHGDVFRPSTSQPLKRISMSPDGFYIVAPGPKKSAFKFMASAFQRDKWEVDLYLVGHLQALSVARCSPVLYKGEHGPNWCVALGSYDCGVSVWKYGEQKPLVLRDLFEAAVADIAWSADGSLLVACSSDGTIATVNFEGALGVPLNRSEYMHYMVSHYGSFPMAAPTALPSVFTSSFIDPKPQTALISPPIIQQEVRTESGKRRIQPQLVSTPQASPAAVPAPAALQSPASFQTPAPFQPSSLPTVPAASSFPRIMHSATAPSVPELSSPIDLPFEAKHTIVLHKADPKDFTSGLAMQSVLTASGMIDTEANLTIGVQHYPAHYRNHHAAAKGKIRCCLGKQIVWEDVVQYTPKFVSGNQQFSVIYHEEGYLSFYTAAGRKMFPEIMIGEIAYLETSATKHAMVISRNGLLTCWNLEDRKVEYTTNVAHLLPSSPNPVAKAELTNIGQPILYLSTGEVHAYDRAMDLWMKVATKSRQALCDSVVPAESKDLVRSQLWNLMSVGDRASAEDFMRLNLSDLEAQLVRAEKLHYSAEYQYLLTRYVNMLVEGREVLKLKELVRELAQSPAEKKALLETVVMPLLLRSSIGDLVNVRL
jgi:protein HIRA/HIR1